MNYFIKVGKGSHMRTYVSTILIIFINLDFKRKILISVWLLYYRGNTPQQTWMNGLYIGYLENQK